MSANKNIAVFILSHERPDNVITYKTLRNCGYTGKIFIIVDDEDKTLSQYKAKYKDEVIVFSKKDYEQKFDIMDNLDGNKVIVYARNACYDIARELGLDYFFEYEDDYTHFQYRHIDKKVLKATKPKNLDDILNATIDCLDETNVTTIAFSQGGDHMGGVRGFNHVSYKRKAMNTFVFKVNQNPADDTLFTGRMNDDVNTYLSQGKIGKLFFQIAEVSVVQLQTQSNAGGNTEAYKAYGTYVKSFYSVMAAPDCCKVALIGSTNRRFHHKINWKYAVPMILDEKYRKPRYAE
jgi:hypothetical protein